MSYLVFKFNAKEPIVNGQLVDEQMFLSHKLRNKLVEVELERRKSIDALCAKLSPDLTDVEKQLFEAEVTLAEAEKQQKGVNASQRKREATKEVRDTLKILRETKASLYKRRKELRTSIFESHEFKAAQEQIEQGALKKSATYRKESLLYSDNSDAVFQAAQSFRKGAPPKFRRWTGDGRVVIRLRKTFSLNQLDRTNLYAQVERHSSGYFVAGKNRPRKLGNALLQFRVGTDKRKPVFATVPFYLSREIPEDARVNQIFLQRRRVGTKFSWSVCFVCSKDSWDKPDWAEDGTVGIDVGWRIFEDRLRVAVWSGSDGDEGELSLPLWWIKEQKRVCSIQSVRDTLFDGIKDTIKSLNFESAPDYVREALQTIHAWKSPARLSAIVFKWLKDGGNGTTIDVLNAWRERDRHLLEFQANLRDQLQRHRKEVYRTFAAQLSRKYATAVVEKIDLRKWHTNAQVEDSENCALREHVRNAALSVLFDSLTQRMRNTIRVNPANTTKNCHECGHLNKVEELEHTCEGCGISWDQDYNAARNLRNSGLVPCEA